MYRPDEPPDQAVGCSRLAMVNFDPDHSCVAASLEVVKAVMASVLNDVSDGTLEIREEMNAETLKRATHQRLTALMLNFAIRGHSRVAAVEKRREEEGASSIAFNAILRDPDVERLTKDKLGAPVRAALSIDGGSVSISMFFAWEWEKGRVK